jgi:hypothetical protein
MMKSSSLLLFVFRGCTDHPHDALASDDLAVFTDSSDAGPDLHDITFSYSSAACLPSGELAYVAEIQSDRNIPQQ